MAEASASLHEAEAHLGEETVDRHRALVSIQEELEAIDWYQQRIDATSDDELAAILVHNRDDEKEHMAMVLEWLRRRDEALDEELRRYLWHPEAVADELVEEQGAGAGGDAGEDEGAVPVPDHGSLRIGSLRGVPQG